MFSGGWQAAILNWEPPIDLANLGEIERHAGTDEAFVLWRGRAALYVAADQDVDVVDMQIGTIYNVTRGAWHGLAASRDASFVIIENRDTHLNDTEVRMVTAEERRQLLEKLPEWARQKP